MRRRLTPGREAEVPQATTTTTEPSVESSAAKRAASPVREERRARDPVGTQKKEEASGTFGPGVPISYAPKYTDDDGDLRERPRESRGHTQLCEHAVPGASGSQQRFGITVSIVPIYPRGAHGPRRDWRRAGRIGGSSFSTSWPGRLASPSSMP